MRLTIGVVSQNGLPFLRKCLESLPPLSDCAETVEFVLVDSASSDGTQQTMLSFASARTDTRVFAMEGKVNLSATRNIVLRNARPGAVFLVDGDVEVKRDFLVAALQEVNARNADIVYGRLPEIWYDADNTPYARRDDRYKVSKRCNVHKFSGIILLGPAVAASGCLYDEAIRRHEDTDLSVELAEKYTILALPIDMGIHHTRNYYSAARINDFYKNAYARPIGIFLRKNIFNPRRIWWARKSISGNVLGFLLQVALIVSVVSGSWLFLSLALGAIGFDVARFIYQKRFQEYIPKRIVSPWRILEGFFFSERNTLSYSVSELTQTQTE